MRARLAPLCLLALVVLPACRSFSPVAADNEVKGLLAARRDRVPEVVGPLDLDAERAARDAVKNQRYFRLDLESAIALALLTSRDHQSAREDVHLAALTLSLERRRFQTLFGAGAGVTLSAEEGTTRIDGDANADATQALRDGGSLALGLALDVLRNLTGNPLNVAQSILEAGLVIPLMRGSGRLVTLEPLRQAEHDTIYALREFARFQQTLWVEVASRYLRALAAEDTWQNEEFAYKSLQILVETQTLQARAGEIAEFQLDQARQDLLRTDDRRLRARRRYQDALDDFKLELGIPVSAEVVLDRGPLERLRSEDEVPPPYDLETGLLRARTERLDLRSALDQERDARRQILVARDALRAQFDLRAGGAVRTPGTQPLNIGKATGDLDLGLDIDLPLERTAERNAVRRAQIRARRSRRTRERLADLIELQVRRTYRALLEAGRSTEIQREGVRLSERRVESTGLLLQQGGADIRDRLDAETSRVQARNALTGALVDRAVAALDLQRDVGSLRVQALHFDAPSATTRPPQAEGLEGDGSPPAEGGIPALGALPVEAGPEGTVAAGGASKSSGSLGSPPTAGTR
jgi:outer membrane protein TolC